MRGRYVSARFNKWEVMTYPLDEELKHESRRCQTSKLVREDPSRDQTGANECSNAHRTSTADPLGKVADNGSTNAGTSLHENARR